MYISIFELFSVGIGPSSSHTVGPMRAAFDFISKLENRLDEIAKLEITIYGSLAYTGKGHGTHQALLMGLEGEQPDRIDPDSIATRMNSIYHHESLNILKKKSIPFSPSHDLISNYKERLSHHPNGMQFIAYNEAGEPINKEIYFSIGGGFIINEKDIPSENAPATEQQAIPYPFDSAHELITHCADNNLSIAEVIMANEKAFRSEETIKKQILHIARTMTACIEKGCRTQGTLMGALNLHRRAPSLYNKLIAEGKPSAAHPQAMNWLNVFAMAVNEENAAGGRIVTAPTNGAAGIIPAVLHYYQLFYPETGDEGVIRFLLTASAIGSLYKKNASISGAEMGCQGEVGVACSMAAGGLAAALGGNIYQVENAAEIGMEHNLGLTCDPVGGLVQIPCIERNAMGAVKAVNSAQLALAEDGHHKISLDMVISTMREIGNNMNEIYKETSQGGLAVAVNVTEC